MINLGLFYFMPHGVDIAKESNPLGTSLVKQSKKQQISVWSTGKLPLLSSPNPLFSTTNRPLCQKFEVRGYPTLKLIHPDGNTYKYNSGRDLASFQEFVKGGFSSAEKSASPKADWGDAV